MFSISKQLQKICPSQALLEHTYNRAQQLILYKVFSDSEALGHDKLFGFAVFEFFAGVPAEGPLGSFRFNNISRVEKYALGRIASDAELRELVLQTLFVRYILLHLQHRYEETAHISQIPVFRLYARVAAVIPLSEYPGFINVLQQKYATENRKSTVLLTTIPSSLRMENRSSL